MSKKIVLAVLVLLAVIGAGAYFVFNNDTSKVLSPLDATYSIAGESVILLDGKSEVEIAPGSASKLTTLVFGQPVTGDLNGDGRPDSALILTRNSGGSGTFYYVAAAISSRDGKTLQGTNALLLGDRIAPQNMDIKDGQLTVNYADRRPDEPMTAAPSVGLSKYFAYDGLMLKEVQP